MSGRDISRYKGVLELCGVYITHRACEFDALTPESGRGRIEQVVGCADSERDAVGGDGDCLYSFYVFLFGEGGGEIGSPCIWYTSDDIDLTVDSVGYGEL